MCQVNCKKIFLSLVFYNIVRGETCFFHAKNSNFWTGDCTSEKEGRRYGKYVVHFLVINKDPMQYCSYMRSLLNMIILATYTWYAINNDTIMHQSLISSTFDQPITYMILAIYTTAHISFTYYSTHENSLVSSLQWGYFINLVQHTYITQKCIFVSLLMCWRLI